MEFVLVTALRHPHKTRWDVHVSALPDRSKRALLEEIIRAQATILGAKCVTANLDLGGDTFHVPLEHWHPRDEAPI